MFDVRSHRCTSDSDSEQSDNEDNNQNTSVDEQATADPETKKRRVVNYFACLLWAIIETSMEWLTKLAPVKPSGPASRHLYPRLPHVHPPQ